MMQMNSPISTAEIFASLDINSRVWPSPNRNSGSDSFVRVPASGGGSNAPRPAVSVTHLDVILDE